MQDDQAKQELIEALRSILQPLVRLLIANGITFPAFSRIGKEVYIEVGTHDFSLSFKRQTDSRVALVTGITRKEIGLIRRGQVPRPATRASRSYGIATRVISRWMTEDAYREASGEPAALPYDDADGSPNFAGLVNEVGGDIPPRAVVDELIRVGAVELTPSGAVRLAQRAYIPSSEAAAKVAILGADVADLIRAITHNIESPRDEAFLQRKVFYDNIGADALSELRARVRDAGGRFAQEMNSVFAEFDRDRNPAAPGGTRKRAVLGVFYLDEDEKGPPPEPGPEEGSPPAGSGPRRVT